MSVFTQVIAPTLVARLAEAASGFVSQLGFEEFQWVFFVASYVPVPNEDEGQPDYAIYGPYATEDKANTIQQGLGDGYSVFGPFSVMPNEFSGPLPAVTQPVVGPISLTPVSLLSGVPGGQPINILGPVDFPAGPEQQPQEYDALFFTQAAVQKFVVPYYTGLYGPGFAGVIEEQFAGAAVGVLGHLPWSEYQTGDGLRNDAVGIGAASGHKRRIQLDVLHTWQQDEHGNFYPREVRPHVTAQARA